MNIYKILWLLPFMCFFGTYFILHNTFDTAAIITPNFVGLSLHKALKKACEHDIHLSILSHTNSSQKSGTILEQIPAASTTIKKKQTVLISIATKPQKPKAPTLYKKTLQELEQYAQKSSLKIIPLVNNAPQNTCFAQYPLPEEQLNTEPLIAYCASKQSKVIMPSFKNMAVKDVIEFLKSHIINIEVIHKNQIGSEHRCTYCHVVGQHPLAGTIVIKENLTVQLEVNVDYFFEH